MTVTPSASVASLTGIVLGAQGKQRVRAAQSRLALLVYAAFAVLQHGEVLLGLVDASASWRLTAIYLAGSLLFYALIRTGLNQRFVADPSMTLAQIVFGLSICVGSYAITGPARGAVMTLLVLILAFAGFSLRAAQSRVLALYALGLLAAVMLWKSRTDPQRYAPAVECVHFAFAAIVLVGIAVLAGRMSRMRQRLKQQKVELERALERIGQMATLDELTGLANRRHMMGLMEAEQMRLRRSGGSMALALIDIDLFKRINDSYGHGAGDEVLKAFARVSRDALRAGDVLARWGGEEFLLLLPGAAPADATVVVERLRARFAAIGFDHIAPGLQVTFSAGLSLCTGADPLGACIERADQGMCRAKSQGRNCSAWC